jgi:hypothetical protein
MRKILIGLVLLLVVVNSPAVNDEGKTRLIILADMGNEPDEEQQMVHMLMYSSEFESQMPILPL